MDMSRCSFGPNLPLEYAEASLSRTVNPADSCGAPSLRPWQANSSWTHHPDIRTTRQGFDLVLSAMITEVRGGGASRHRFSRMAVFHAVLRSYAALDSLERAFLYVSIDTENSSSRMWSELARLATALFGPRLVAMRATRLTTQDQWRHELKHIIAPTEEGDSRPVWLLMNDDHPFIDIDSSVLREGLLLLREEPRPFKSLYVTHWPEALRMVGKLQAPQRRGRAWVAGNTTMLDSVQLLNWGFARWVLDTLEWPANLTLTRLDSTVLNPLVVTVGSASLVKTSLCCQTMLVPLRELCRKFDGYGPQRISFADVPQLVLSGPPDAQAVPPVKRSVAEVLKVMLASDQKGTLCTHWMFSNRFHLPIDWLKKGLELYGHPPHDIAPVLVNLTQERPPVVSWARPCVGRIHG